MSPHHLEQKVTGQHRLLFPLGNRGFVLCGLVGGVVVVLVFGGVGLVFFVFFFVVGFFGGFCLFVCFSERKQVPPLKRL